MHDDTCCLSCGRALPPSASTSGNKRCRPCARAFRSAAACVECGTSLATRRATRFCSKRCTDVHRGVRLPAPLDLIVCAATSADGLFLGRVAAATAR